MPSYRAFDIILSFSDEIVQRTTHVEPVISLSLIQMPIVVLRCSIGIEHIVIESDIGSVIWESTVCPITSLLLVLLLTENPLILVLIDTSGRSVVQ